MIEELVRTPKVAPRLAMIIDKEAPRVIPKFSSLVRMSDGMKPIIASVTMQMIMMAGSVLSGYRHNCQCLDRRMKG